MGFRFEMRARPSVRTRVNSLTRRASGEIMTGRWWFGAVLVVALSLSSQGRTASSAPLANFEAALSQLAKELADQNLPVAQRLEIVRVLAGWGTPEVREPLLAALKDPSDEIRASAAAALGAPSHREAAPALRQLAESPQESALVRAGAVEALGSIGDASSRPLLVGATRHTDARVRQAALKSLAFGPLVDPADRVTYLIQLAEDGALQQLLRCDAIREVSNPEVAKASEDRVVDALIRILENEPRFAMALPEGGGNPQQIMEIRRIQARDVAAWAAEGLGNLKAKRASALLLRTAEDRSDFFLRLVSLRSLILLELPDARPVFVRLLEDAVPDVRTWALIGLGQLADRTAVGAVKGRLTDTSPLVRTQAVKTLALLGDATARPVLEDLQKRETDSNVQFAVEEALTKLPR
jgi:HEAT repeat protein